MGKKEASSWSTPALFQVAAPTAEQFQEALEIVRSYLAIQEGGGGGEADATEAEPASEPDSPALAGAPAPQALAPTALSVDQGIAAASFTGDGSALSNLDPTALSSGTAGIDISGNAATATSATMASDLACTDCVSESELDFDPSTQTELDSHRASSDHDAAYVNISGDTMSGALSMGSNTITEVGAPGTSFTATGGLTLSDDLEISKVLVMPHTIDSTTGVLYKTGDRFLHNFNVAGTDGFNLFLGTNAGNFTMSAGDPADALHASYNTGIGTEVLYFNTTGNANTATGSSALSHNTTGFRNTANGTWALIHNTTGSGNTASGVDALYSNTTGGSNTAYGLSALWTNTIGASNTAVGADALLYSTTGEENIALGFKAGENLTSGSHNIVIGVDIDVPSATASNQMSIGNLIFATGVDGRDSTVSTGKVGIGTASPAQKLDVVGSIQATAFLGDGSGLTGVSADTAANSSLLDSLDSTQFLRSDTSDSLTSGTLTLEAGTTLDVDGAVDASGATGITLPATTIGGDVSLANGETISNTTDEVIRFSDGTDTFDIDLSGSVSLVGSPGTGEFKIEGAAGTAGGQGTTVRILSGAGDASSDGGDIILEPGEGGGGGGTKGRVQVLGDLTAVTVNGDGSGLAFVNAQELGGLASSSYLTISTSFGGDVAGVYSNLQLGADSVGGNEIADGSVTASDISDGSGSGLNADLLDGQDSSAFTAAGSAWLLAGNAGTTPGTDFIGTTDSQALELHANSTRLMQLAVDAVPISEPSANTPLDIPDNDPNGLRDTITVPPHLPATTFSVGLQLNNSDISDLTITLTDPDMVVYTLWDSSKGGGTEIDTSFPDPEPTVSGDLTTWIGRSPTGVWSLKIVDSDAGPSPDGQLIRWSIDFQVLGDPNVQVYGRLAVDGEINSSGAIHGVGIGLTGLDASNLEFGTVPAGRLTGTYGINVSGTAANVTGTVAVANGGTGATDAAGARTNLGVNLAAVLALGSDAANTPITNIGAAGTDFTGTGGLTLADNLALAAGELVVNSGDAVTIADNTDGDTFTIDLGGSVELKADNTGSNHDGTALYLGAGPGEGADWSGGGVTIAGGDGAIGYDGDGGDIYLAPGTAAGTGADGLLITSSPGLTTHFLNPAGGIRVPGMVVQDSLGNVVGQVFHMEFNGAVASNPVVLFRDGENTVLLEIVSFASSMWLQGGRPLYFPQQFCMGLPIAGQNGGFVLGDVRYAVGPGQVLYRQNGSLQSGVSYQSQSDLAGACGNFSGSTDGFPMEVVLDFDDRFTPPYGLR